MTAKSSTAADLVGGILAELLAQQIAIPRMEEVRDYLNEHRDLAQLVPGVCALARQEFSDASEFSLEIYRDAESRDHYLCLYVWLPDYRADMMERLERVWAQMGDELDEASGYLHVTAAVRVPGSDHAV